MESKKYLEDKEEKRSKREEEVRNGRIRKGGN